MILNIKQKWVLDDLDQMIDKFPELDHWLKEHISVDHIHWDTDRNFKTIVDAFFKTRPGFFSVLQNKTTEEIMVCELEQPAYLISGPYSDMSMMFGTLDDIKANFLSYMKIHHHASLDNYEEAVKFLEDNPDDEHPVLAIGLD